MNDITALAQQLLATAEKANEHGEFNMAMHTVEVLALVEALEKAQQPAEPFGFTDGDAHGMVYEPRHADRLANPCPVYRLPPLESKSRTVTVKLYSAVSDLLAERERQVSAEGWTPKHDDQYEHGQLAGAASCYARHVNSRGWIFPSNPESYQQEPESTNWPWTHDWWKPTNPRRDLVKAGALILAEIERIDRATGIQVIEGDQKNG